MADTEDEQLEAIKNWWNENGTSLVVTVVVVIAGRGQQFRGRD